MHHIYHTEGFILGSRGFGEESKYFYILTKDLGLLYASASGVRKMSSKLRYVLQDFAYIKVDLVQGKDFWRVTSASKTNQLENLTKTPKVLRVVTNISRLLKRLLAGVEPNPELFENLKQGLLILEKYENNKDLENTEVILVLRILYNLGYIGGGEALEVLTQSPFEEGMLYHAAQNRNKILAEINQALRETHL